MTIEIGLGPADGSPVTAATLEIGEHSSFSGSDNLGVLGDVDGDGFVDIGYAGRHDGSLGYGPLEGAWEIDERADARLVEGLPDLAQAWMAGIGNRNSDGYDDFAVVHHDSSWDPTSTYAHPPTAAFLLDGASRAW